MPGPSSFMDADSDRRSSDHFVLDKKVPIAVLFMLAFQFVFLIWGGAIFYANQENIAVRFEENFTEINVKFQKIENTMFSRQEAVIQLESLRQTDSRQEEDIRQLRADFREVLLKRVLKHGDGS